MPTQRWGDYGEPAADPTRDRDERRCAAREAATWYGMNMRSGWLEPPCAIVGLRSAADGRERESARRRAAHRRRRRQLMRGPGMPGPRFRTAGRWGTPPPLTVTTHCCCDEVRCRCVEWISPERSLTRIVIVAVIPGSNST